MSEFVQSADGVGLFVEKMGAGASTVIVPNSVYMRRDFARLAGKHTVILFDMRNRGQSGVGVHPEGVWGDVEDIEAIRTHFGVEQTALIGHSYLGLVVALYAMRYPQWVTRVIQISPAQSALGKPYAPPLSYSDDVLKEVWAGLQAMESQRGVLDSAEFCKKWWQLGRPLFVMDPAHVEGIRDWGFCELTNERNFMNEALDREHCPVVAEGAIEGGGFRAGGVSGIDDSRDARPECALWWRQGVGGSVPAWAFADGRGDRARALGGGAGGGVACYGVIFIVTVLVPPSNPLEATVFLHPVRR